MCFIDRLLSQITPRFRILFTGCKIVDPNVVQREVGVGVTFDIRGLSAHLDHGLLKVHTFEYEMPCYLRIY